MKKFEEVVLIINHIENRKNMNLYSRDNEFSSNTMYNAIKTSLLELTDKLYEYTSLNYFIENISYHKNAIVISTIWSGIDSRNRRIFLPAICEAYGIKYIGADAYVQALSADKVLSKEFSKQYGIKSAKSITIRSTKDILLINTLTYPLVIKPNFEGGSIGISDNNIVNNFNEANILILNLLQVYKEIIAEEYLEGNEVSVCITGKPNKIKLFEVVKLSLGGVDFFDHQILGFESKKGGKLHQERTIITDNLNPRDKENLLKLFKNLGKVDYMRIDGRIKNGEFYLIELTPDCSLHPDCYMFTAYKHNKYTYTEMIYELLTLA